MRVDFLAHDLAVHLALRWHVEDEVALHARHAPEAAVAREPAIRLVRALDLGHVREVRPRRRDPVLRVLALVDGDLAPPADPASPAHGVEVDAERAGRVEDGRPALETSAPS
jgi:hypothetical protein